MKNWIGWWALLLLAQIGWSQLPGEVNRIIEAPIPGEDRYLRYETMDVVFYIPYTDELVEQMKTPGKWQLYENGPTLWQAWETPEYMVEWRGVLEQFKEGNVASLDERPGLSRLVYVVMREGLLAGEIPLYDREAGKFIRQYTYFAWDDHYSCECYDGSLVKGSIRREQFVASTEQTAQLLFYTRQSQPPPDCCMEEFPAPDLEAEHHH